MATARNIISSIGVIDSPGDGLKILQPYNSTTDNRYILTGTSGIQTLSNSLGLSGTLYLPSSNSAQIVATNSDLILSSSSTNQITLSGTLKILAPNSGTSFSLLTFVGSGSILNCVSGALGINVSPSASYPLDVEGVMGGHTVAKFGDNLGVYVVENSPNIGLNAYVDSAGNWRYGKGSKGNYAAEIQLLPGTGQLQFIISSASGSADGTPTMKNIFVLSGTGPAAQITAQDVGATANSALAMQNLSNPANNLNLYMQLGNGSYNPLTVANDLGIIFSSGTVSTGTLVIAPWSGNGWGIRIDGTNGIVGINTQPSFPLDVSTGNGGKAGGNQTIARIGNVGSNPIYLGNGDATVGFNSFFSSSWRFGSTLNNFGSSFDYNAVVNQLVFQMSNAPGTFPNAITLNTAFVVSGSASNGCTIGIGGVPGVGQQLDLTSDHARKLTTTTWTTGCDERIKEDIQIADYNLCLSGVMNLDLKYFKWKDLDWITTSDRHQLGWVAQDITSSFPKSVDINTEKGFDDFHSLNADQIYKMTYGAVKQLIIENQTLKQRLFNLETLLSTSF